MPPRHGQSELVDRMRGLALAVTKQDREMRLTIIVIKIGETDVGLRIFAVSKDAPVLYFAYQRLHNGVIGAHDREAIKWDVFHKGTECILHRVECLEMIEMLRVDVRYNGDVGR